MPLCLWALIWTSMAFRCPGRPRQRDRSLRREFMLVGGGTQAATDLRPTLRSVEQSPIYDNRSAREKGRLFMGCSPEAGPVSGWNRAWRCFTLIKIH
ncbi:hypothetical protein BAV2482 [Bordetella avium 197N]|uniref:Uncharacterized protein n=1 Tax=Bordetella avium (strain 197N) TaxID=360910 RepID=Q2KXI3_BORA1|nr:hypothetical protein BAV2482 [Bordetella avium 197N]